jgi:hypothetical protein
VEELERLQDRVLTAYMDWRQPAASSVAQRRLRHRLTVDMPLNRGALCVKGYATKVAVTRVTV